ncbi:MAG: hypothetical protein ACI8P0_006440, partial [Planctomycetaceae bacterium]
DLWAVRATASQAGLHFGADSKNYNSSSEA